MNNSDPQPLSIDWTDETDDTECPRLYAWVSVNGCYVHFEACVLLPVLKKFIGAHAPEGEVTPGAAAFETWMQVVAVREDGYRNDYWDELSAGLVVPVRTAWPIP